MYLHQKLNFHPNCRKKVYHLSSKPKNYSLTGSGSVHTAHGIMMQEILSGMTEDHGGEIPEVPENTKK